MNSNPEDFIKDALQFQLAFWTVAAVVIAVVGVIAIYSWISFLRVKRRVKRNVKDMQRANKSLEWLVDSLVEYAIRSQSKMDFMVGQIDRLMSVCINDAVLQNRVMEKGQELDDELNIALQEVMTQSGEWDRKNSAFKQLCVGVKGTIRSVEIMQREVTKQRRVKGNKERVAVLERYVKELRQYLGEK